MDWKNGVIDIRRTMRCIEAHVRSGAIHRDAELIVKRLLQWKRPDRKGVEATLDALQRELRMARDRIIGVLAALERLNVLTKIRQRVYRADLGKTVQGCNLYVFSVAPPEFSGQTASIPRRKTLLVDKFAAVARVAAAGFRGACDSDEQRRADESRDRQLAWIRGGCTAAASG